MGGRPHRPLSVITSDYGEHVMPDEEGINIVLSPAQLAAVLVGESIAPDHTLTNRLWGGARAIGGALELIGAFGLAVAPEPTMVTKAGAVVLAAHGGDT